MSVVAEGTTHIYKSYEYTQVGPECMADDFTLHAYVIMKCYDYIRVNVLGISECVLHILYANVLPMFLHRAASCLLCVCMCVCVCVCVCVCTIVADSKY